MLIQSFDSTNSIRFNSIKYPFIALQVGKGNIKDICNHNNHSAVDKNKKGNQFTRKLSVHSTIWPRSPLYPFVN